MRSIWKGAVAFGLVNVPIRVYSATEDHDLDLHQVHDADGGRIRYERRCEVCGRKVDYDDIDKAYEHGDRTVILTDEDLSTLPEESSKEVEVLQFVPSDQIDPLMLERSYYLAPESSATKPYALLRQALVDTELTAVVRFTLRKRTRLAALGVRDDVLTLQRLRWDDEVRTPDFEVDLDADLSDSEVSMAADLVASLRSDFTPEDFTDEYADELEQLVEAKLEQGNAVDTGATFGEEPTTDDDAEVIDLMDALRQSVDRARDDRGARGSARTRAAGDKEDSGSSTAKKGTAKKSTAKKSTAKKNTAKKNTAKKSTTKKSTTKKSTTKKSTTAKKDSAKKDSAKKDSAKKDSAKKDTAKKDTARRSSGGARRAS